MRQYRGLTREGKWVYGHLMNMHTSDRFFIGVWHRIGGEARIKDELFSSYTEVLPKTVGQSTGLKDKNGREIYEDDITADKCVIKFDTFITGDDYGTKAIGYCITDGKCTWGLEPDFPETIIANRHENPELLKP
jgi:uncharacterized phage protein (TIGR01671 family)